MIRPGNHGDHGMDSVHFAELPLEFTLPQDRRLEVIIVQLALNRYRFLP